MNLQTGEWEIYYIKRMQTTATTTKLLDRNKKNETKQKKKKTLNRQTGTNNQIAYAFEAQRNC